MTANVRSWVRARRMVAIVAVGVSLGSPLLAQRDSARANLSGQYYGPRVGVTFLSSGVLAKAKEKKPDIAPLMLQFGWQWETRFDPGTSAPILASAFVLVLGGAEQGVLLPSLSWLLGVRSAGGGEFGIGPIVSLTGVNLALAFGGTARNGDVNIPIDFVVVLGKPGLRLSLLTGFNMNRKRIEQ